MRTQECYFPFSYHLTPAASENAKKLLVISLLVTCDRYGYGAENILSMRVVLADGRIAEVTAEKTEVGIFFRLENDFLRRKYSPPDPLSNAKHGGPHGE